ncbi:ABC transporter ATP-binding protein [Qiania dongpingensis]|uniref:ABC transporter ATP-binding protein n=1 Tax=Qiania dongpingensis TaxID=2763669 RepID=A0A7G9G7A2_9FIRM|nr:ABC transporter ATP-binding protein [Qiania dongpingensis]QNM06684.1 ABC transporter ATP-binding protein [Qiania dongpingensis]
MLKTEGVTIRFGGLVAVNKVSIHVRKGQITGLIGPNGAGKTTFFNCISGVYTPAEGSVIFDGKHVEGLKPHKINEVGMARTYQVINLFRQMTVQENIMVGMHTRLKSNFWSDMLHLPSERKEEKFVREETEKWMEFVGLQDMANQQAGSLSYGKQRLLEIVRGLASGPKLILLDEPVAGMNSKEKEEFDALLRRILDLDVTILMIEHDMKLVMGVCDYVYCLEHGTLLAEGVPEVVQNHPDVIAAYLGGDE